MIPGRAFLVLLFESILVVFGLPRLGLPDPGLAFSAQAGLRRRGDEDLKVAVLLGLCAGVFGVESWTLPVLTNVLAAITAAELRRRLMPGKVRGAWLVFLVALSIAGLAEIALRLSVPALRFQSDGAILLLLRCLSTAVFALIVDLGAERGEVRATWK